MIRMLAMIGTLGAGQAMALEPIPECQPEGAELAAGILPYSLSFNGNGFVMYPSRIDGDGDFRLILDDCAGAWRLSMVSVKRDDPDANADAERDLFKAVQGALDSRQRYTMGQIEAVARKAGAKTDLAKAGYISCGCQLFGGKP